MYFTSEDKSTLANLKRAYKDLVLKLHPDKGGNAEQFKAMQNEYEGILQSAGLDEYMVGINYGTPSSNVITITIDVEMGSKVNKDSWDNLIKELLKEG